jgi:hypothetical protein
MKMKTLSKLNREITNKLIINLEYIEKNKKKKYFHYLNKI